MALSGNQKTRLAVGGSGAPYAGFTAKIEGNANPWTVQTNSSDAWSAQSNSTDTWTVQTNSTDTWT